MKLVLATKNKGKIKEFTAAFEQVGYDIVTLDELPYVEEPEETGTTFAENALLKAKYYALQTGYACLADDSGLMVDALDGAPGIYSARYAGVEGADKDAANNAKLIECLQDVPQAERTARYVCALALVAMGDEDPLVTEGYCEGCIVSEPIGEGGFGYDPYFYVDTYGTTMANITLQEKQEISHRGQALRKMLEKVKA